MLQLTALVAHKPVTQGEKPLVNLDRGAISDEEVHGVLLCVQDFVRSLHLTRGNFLFESGAPKLSEFADTADAITSGNVHDPRSHIETVSAALVVSDLRACFERAIDCR